MSEIAGVLVRFSLTGLWGGKATDEQITSEVHERHGASGDSGKYRTELFPESACGENNPHRRWLSAGWKLRSYHYKWTLPWEKPLRLVTAAHHEKYDQEVAALAAAVVEAGAEFFQWYPQGKELARSAHNGSYNPDLYPDVVKLQARFAFERSYSPVPAEHHFVQSLAGPTIERARAEFEARNQRLVEDAISHAWREVLDPVLRLAQRLATPDALVREDLVQGIRETLERVPALNLTNDPALQQAANAIRQALLGVSAAGLRDSPVQRLETAKQTLAVLQRFGTMGNRKFA
jgi:hypothetical protein